MTTHPLIEGSIMGLAIFGVDMILRPNFASSNVMEMLLFLLEGVACDLVYGMLKSTNSLGNGFGSNISLVKSIMAGATIWLSDMFLRPTFTGSPTMELLKFLVQGILVLFVFRFEKD